MNDGGLFWVQDFSLQGKSIDEVRSTMPARVGVQLEVQGMATGSYTIHPYDAWQGVYVDVFDMECTSGESCIIALPDFISDMAFKIIRK